MIIIISVALFEIFHEPSFKGGNMNKHVISSLMVLILSVCVVTVSSAGLVYAQTDKDNLINGSVQNEFVINNGILTEYKGNAQDVIIPDTVREIGEKAFLGKGLKKVIIPETVTYIGKDAFYNCKELKEVCIDGNKLKEIGEKAFSNCKSLYLIELPEGVEKIGKSAFSSSSLVFLKTPSTLKEVGNSAFFNTKLFGVSLNKGLKTVGSSAFETCYSLQGLFIPSSVTSIGNSVAGDNGSSFKYLVIDNDNANIGKSLTDNMNISYFGGLSSNFKSHYDAIYNKKPTKCKLKFNDKSTFVSYSEFSFIEKSKDLKPDEVYAPILSKKPADVSFDTVNYFSIDPNIAKVDKGGKITAMKIGKTKILAIGGNKLACIDIRVKVDNLSDLFKVENGKLVAYSGHDEEITIPDNVSTISSSVFKNNQKIRKIVCGKNVEKIEDNAFENCVNLKEITIDNKTSLIGKAVFKNCTALENIELPNQLSVIDKSAFAGCRSLRNIRFPEKLRSIENGAFSGCSSIQRLDIPEAVTHVGKFAFLNMNNLEEINLPSTFTEIDPGSIIPELFQSRSDVSNEKLKQINVNPKNTRFQSYEGCIYEGKSLLYAPQAKKEVIVKKDTEIVGEYAFGTHLNHLKKVILPEGLKRIEPSAFQDCHNLESINVPDTVEYIGAGAFLATEKLPSINVPKNLKKIGNLSFYEMESLKSLKLPDAITEIPEHAVAGLESAKVIILPRYLKTVEKCGMSANTSFRDLYLPETLQTIGYQGFGMCSNLDYLELPSSLKSIGDESFSLAFNLKSAYIPGNIKVGKDVFKDKFLKASKNNTVSNESHNDKFYIFSHKANQTIKKLANNKGFELIDLDYIKKCDRKVEVQRLESVLSTKNHDSKFRLEVTGKQTKDNEIIRIAIKGYEENQSIENLINPLKLVIELKPEEEAYTNLFAYKYEDGKYTPLEIDRLDRYIRIDATGFADYVISNHIIKNQTSDSVNHEVDPKVEYHNSSDNYISLTPISPVTGESTQQSNKSKHSKIGNESVEKIKEPEIPMISYSDAINHWAKDAINYVAIKGYFKGIGNNLFAPNQPITRADFVTVLGRMAQVDQSKFTKNPFKDLDTNYYTSYVIWAAEKGIVHGTGAGKFDPNRAITREEMAVMMSNFLKESGKNITEVQTIQFIDNKAIAPWAQECVNELARKGIIKGMEDGYFRPKSSFTRAQVAQVLFNIGRF